MDRGRNVDVLEKDVGASFGSSSLADDFVNGFAGLSWHATACMTVMRSAFF